MYIVVMHKHSFTQYQYIAKSVSYANDTYTVVESNNTSHTFAKADYLIAIMS